MSYAVAGTKGREREYGRDGAENAEIGKTEKLKSGAEFLNREERESAQILTRTFDHRKY